MPRLLDGSLQEKCRLAPSRLTLDLRLSPLSTAVMHLPDTEPDVAVRDLVELYDEQGSAGVFRVTEIDREPGLTRVVHLEHGLATLSDGVVPAMSFTGTLRAAIDALLSHQPQPCWTAGEIDFPEDTTVIFSCGCTNLLTALTDLIDLLPDSLMLDFDQSGPEWVMHLRQMGSEDACEGRLDRNLSSVSVTTDASGLCTRVYPYGAGQGMERISLLPLTGTDYLESDATARWGLICRTFTASSVFDAPTLRALAEKYLERHSEPTVSVTASGVDLSAMTGESADRFRLGQICRLALPREGLVMHERIVGLRKPDVIGSPGLVTVTLCSRVKDTSDEIADMLREVTASRVIGGRVSDVTTNSRAQGSSNSPIVHYFRVEDWAAVLSCTMTFDPDDGVTVLRVAVDGNAVPQVVFGDGSFDALPYLRRDSLGVIDTGRHTLSLFPNSGAVNSTVTMKVIEKI